MASRPNPSWTKPQVDIFKILREAEEIVIPYSGPEIPSLDNHTAEQVCDQLGVVKQARKAVEGVEKTLVSRFKARFMADKTELRGIRYEASLKGSERVALNQGAIKDLLIRADELGLSLTRLLASVEAGSVKIPDNVNLGEFETNTHQFNASTAVETLRVDPIK